MSALLLPPGERLYVGARHLADTGRHKPTYVLIRVIHINLVLLRAGEITV